MFDMSKREIRGDTQQYVGDAKIGKATGNGGMYPQLRLPRTYAHLIGKKAHLLEITQDGQTAFLISTSDGLNSSTEGLNQSEQVLPPQLSATTASDPIIVPAPLRDTPTGSRSGGPKRVVWRRISAFSFG